MKMVIRRKLETLRKKKIGYPLEVGMEIGKAGMEYEVYRDHHLGHMMMLIET